MQKELRQVADAARAQGWEIEFTQATHTRWTCPRCGAKVPGTVSPSPGNVRPFVVKLRRHGLSYQGRTGWERCPVEWQPRG